MTMSHASRVCCVFLVIFLAQILREAIQTTTSSIAWLPLVSLKKLHILSYLKLLFRIS
ncbi:unnamed protein product [Albugo candida]|uniref:Uncharacterized protein n=1 Tax=Albugo candida TaxID=65357 RepID=A0A024FUI6_9STRA|nr:unnamed protein product [Albugo candida]|eukprot:CCI10319.1 unnamed protein product [Albugo candida]